MACERLSRCRFQSTMFIQIISLWVVLFVAVSAIAEEGTSQEDTIAVDAESIRKAVEKSIPLLEIGMKGAFEKRKQCFTCHNLGLPVMAITIARSRGIKIDETLLDSQLQFTSDFLKRNKSDYLSGKGQGGQVDTAGYALWTLNHGGRAPDETTAAVAEYFLLYQHELPHYKPQSRRPPSEQSTFTSSFLALRGLKAFGMPDQQERITARFKQVRDWLLETKAEDHEDRVFRLRALHLSAAPENEIHKAAKELLDSQREDGGWSQLPEMKSDAYATGTALVALYDAKMLTTEAAAYKKGVSYLLLDQKGDGSWHVSSRSVPFQTYFESGYPHEKDQFISIAAASWSTTALGLSLPAIAVELSKQPESTPGKSTP